VQASHLTQGAAVASVSQLQHLARIRAIVVFPTPLIPEKIKHGEAFFELMHFSGHQLHVLCLLLH
jgi:hypothetical protein